MRKGQAWPNSGGSTMVGNSGVSVSVRSTMRIPPLASAPMNWARICALMLDSLSMLAAGSGAQLAFEALGVFGQAHAEFLGHVAHVDFFQAVLERADNGLGHRLGRHARR